MKWWYDHRAEVHVFSPGDQVLALLPVIGSPFQAKFSGPYSVLRQVSDVNYLISTPDRRRVSQLCHVNMLKPYFLRSTTELTERETKPVALAALVSVVFSSLGKEDGEEPVHTPDDCVMQTLESLNDLDRLLNICLTEKKENCLTSFCHFLCFQTLQQKPIS